MTVKSSNIYYLSRKIICINLEQNVCLLIDLFVKQKKSVGFWGLYITAENCEWFRISLVHDTRSIFMKFGTSIMGIGAHHNGVLINLSHHLVCLYLYPPAVARQRLDKKITAATIELLNPSFSMHSVWCQRKLGNYVHPELLVILSTDDRLCMLIKLTKRSPVGVKLGLILSRAGEHGKMLNKLVNCR